ncbi:MAG: glycosyltransferase family 2 protein [Chlamydiales bacterium]|nr:glycosyltransferase family 2 protein [Chlamydiia bacterium]MCP5508736.1 glycosyltransferase family 2 protein [Chlamydiales bacterium]
MTTLIAILCALITLPGTIELFFLTAGALLPQIKRKQLATHPKLAVVIPAHNEEKYLLRTIDSIKACTGVFDVVVVADNCTDGTVEIAKAAGVDVIERNDQARRGKHYALQHAFKDLHKDYEWFLVIDADTVVDGNCVHEVCRAIANGAHAVQVRYGVHDPGRSSRHHLLHVAFLAFNGLRPRGRAGWRLSCGILGNGFAVSRELIRHVPFDISSIVEDIAYHIKLLEAGYRVEYVDTTAVYGEMPSKERGMMTQRNRWEGGRMQLVADELPWLLKDVRKGRWRLLEPMLDLLTMPLGYHLIFVLLALFLGAVDYGVIALGTLFIHVSLAILYYGSLSDFKVVFEVPSYLFWKVSRLPQIFFKNPKWEKTQR